eukprot:CAMPEP_0203669784 /NCGR_PEP_ID=MMETSP0090-20130426/6050_1 /ASSEMBLY_ACC=CAM_ASM_001088 /TAXON_ID=426623 /ORGANISM="Chaetoceros affinis, Strain CCMP159" /LENGTH=377 /DNA_ID=CAMNT_0050534521 /DNA_START=54 /DNA_END=1188 /DNA_ORIENTATION=+
MAHLKLRRIPVLLSLFLINFLEFTSSYNVYNYDLTTPLFTPDGLLKQVEYAAAAPTHCTPMVVVPIIIHSRETNGPELIVIMATLSSPVNKRKDSEEEQENGEAALSRITSRGQSRIIQIPISAPPRPGNGGGYLSTGSGASLLVGINGLLPDCISLLRQARDELHSYHKKYGVHRLHTSRDGMFSGSSSISYPSMSPFSSSSSCAFRFAKSIADKCQEHSFGGGLRPFGSQIVICGVDKETMNIFVTDSSGAVTQHSYDVGSSNTSNKDRDFEREEQSVEDVIVLGGDQKFQVQIRNHILDNIAGLKADRQIKDIIRVIGQALTKELGNKKSMLTAIDNSEDQSLVDGLDLVVLGSQNCHEIDNEQMIEIMKRLEM